jgi:protein phosphatase
MIKSMAVNEMVACVGLSDVGRVRRLNEDNFALLPDYGFYLVADGMGGQAAGEIAAEIAVKRISDFITMTELSGGATWPVAYNRRLSHGHNRLMAAFTLANSAIIAEAGTDASHKGMGTTAVAALLEKDLLQIAHVGDSRAYMLRDGELHLLTRDHTWVNQQLENGFISEEEARSHPYRNIITRALGAADEVEVEHVETRLEKGDVVLLCSDGLSGMVDDAEIAAVISAGKANLDECARQLIERANSAGGRDNITVVLFRYAE